MGKSLNEYLYGVMTIGYAIGVVLCIWVCAHSLVFLINISEMSAWAISPYTPASAQMVWFLFLYSLLLVFMFGMMKMFLYMIDICSEEWDEEIAKRKAREIA